MTKEEFISVLSPSSTPFLHETKRVIFVDKLIPLFIDFFNAHKEESHSLMCIANKSTHSKKCVSKHSMKRYKYHGGDHGCLDNTFSDYDMYFINHYNGDKVDSEISIPRFNIAHFVCDYLETEEKCLEFIDFIFNKSTISNLNKILTEFKVGL